MIEHLPHIPEEKVLLIPFNDVFFAVESRTYYKGEVVKRKDMDADLTQSSSDDNTEMSMYATTAANMVSAIIITKIPHARLIITKDDIVFAFEDVIKPNTKPLIQKAIFDYIVNWCLYMWYHTTWPDLADPYLQLQKTYEDEVVKTTNMLKKVVKRRYVVF